MTLSLNHVQHLMALAPNLSRLDLRKDEVQHKIRCHAPGDPDGARIATLPGAGVVGRRWLAAVHADDEVTREGQTLVVTAPDGVATRWTQAEYAEHLVGALEGCKDVLNEDYLDALTMNRPALVAHMREAVRALVIASPKRRAPRAPRAPRPPARTGAERARAHRERVRRDGEATVSAWLDAWLDGDVPDRVTTTALYAEFAEAVTDWRDEYGIDDPIEDVARRGVEDWLEEPADDGPTCVPVVAGTRTFHEVARRRLGKPRRTSSHLVYVVRDARDTASAIAEMAHDFTKESGERIAV